MAERVVLDYRPTKKQLMFHQSKADIILYGGAAGGGKSKACVMDAFLRCARHPGTHAYLFRRSYPELKDTLILEASRSIPRAVGRYKTGSHDLVLTNGSVLHFRHCLRDNDRFLYAGAEIHWLYFDELTTFSKIIFDFLRTRLRANASLKIKPIVRCTSNPGGVGHAWVKSMFVDSAKHYEMHVMEVFSETLGDKQVRRLQYIPAYATDNPHITKDYIFELEQKPDALRRALLNGDWDAFEGQAFPEFTDNPDGYLSGIKSHVIEPFEIPNWWPRMRSFDHGYSRPFSVGWWATGPDGRLYRYKEWYGCVPGESDVGLKMDPSEIARGIYEREAEEREQGITVYGVCDPSLDDHSRGTSIMDAMGQEGIYFSKGDNQRLAGKMQMHYRLRFRSDGKPMLYVFKNCKDFIRLIPTLSYAEIRVEDVNTKSEDHIYDEARYRLMEAPIAPTPPVERKPRKWNPLED